MIRRLILLGCMILAPLAGAQDRVYLQPEKFIEQSFSHAPSEQKLWLSGEVGKAVTKILEHRYPSLRVSYWLQNGRSAWILEEIGKERPITTGIVVNERGIEKVSILVYRESRGGEVRFPSFTKQFTEASLDEEKKLDRRIDSISGATMSVNAIKKLGAMALYLHSVVTDTSS